MFKKIIVAVLLLHAMASASTAGSLILKVTDPSYKPLPDVRATVRAAGHSWRGYTDRDGVLRIKDVPENEKFEIIWDRGDAEPIRTQGMCFPSGGADLPVSIEYGIVHKGDHYAVRMPSNPTTGYEWEMLCQDLSGSLTYIDKSYETSATRPGSKLKCGTGGTEKWMFKATGLGRTQVLFGYKRSWEKEKTPISYHICTVMSRIVHK